MQIIILRLFKDKKIIRPWRIHHESVCIVHAQTQLEAACHTIPFPAWHTILFRQEHEWIAISKIVD